jgi:hypothetical protein
MSKMMRNVVLACAALFAVPACGGDDAKVEKLIEIMEELGAAAKKGGDDCGKIADAMKPVVEKRADDLKELKEWAESMKGDKEKAQKMMEKYQDRLMKAMSGVMDVSFKCMDDEKFKAVGEKMKGML